mmetsp:Transcript_20420/g.15048  ORF Transcript_20420/g.15048 Transcript_20420/m.15048 type:complete len:192 (-) Transcript_20420:878-1453(-)
MSGLKHIMNLLVTKGEPRASEFSFSGPLDIAIVSYPGIIHKCSQICLIVEKKLSFCYVYNEQDLGYQVATLRQKEKQFLSMAPSVLKVIRCGETPFSSLQEVVAEREKLIARRDNLLAQEAADIKDGNQDSNGEDDDKGSGIDEDGKTDLGGESVKSNVDKEDDHHRQAELDYTGNESIHKKYKINKNSLS